MMSKATPDFVKFGGKAKQTATKKASTQVVEPTGFKHLQVRLSADDAKRFKRAADDRGMSVQGGLVEAINKIIIEWGESPVSDPGSAGKKP